MKNIKNAGVVVAALLLSSLFLWQAWAQDATDTGQAQENKIYLPWISSNHTQSNTADAAASAEKCVAPTPTYPVHPDDQHWLEIWDELPCSETPYEGAPVLRPDPGYVLANINIPPIESFKPSEPIIVSGPETAGSKINILDKEIQLPPDVYVEAVVVSIECLITIFDDGTSASDPCPKTPFTVLSTLNGDSDLRIESDGQVYAGEVGSEGIDGDRKKFQFVLDALGTELKP